MTTEFAPNIVAFGDEAGFGQWLVGHYRQHLNYNTVLANRNPPVILAVQPILTVQGGEQGLRFWLDAHANWHDAVRPFANITGIDLSEVSFKHPEQFMQWMDLHAQEHGELDIAFALA